MDDDALMVHIAKAVGGDADALQVLLIQHHEALRAKVVAGMGSAVDRHVDADDVLQDAYAKAFRAVTECSFENPRAFHAWLDGVVMNTLRDQHRFLRRKKRDIRRDAHRATRTSESYEQLFERMVATDTTPSRKVAKTEAAAAVVSSLARLTDEQRRVVQLRFLEGWDVAEVARYLDKSEAAVHMLCHRGLTALHEVMLSVSRFFSTP